LSDTLQRLLEEAREEQDLAPPGSPSGPTEAYQVGHLAALLESLHTWANQIQTFGLEQELGQVWDELHLFLTSKGY
jgi:hypothetical protein